MGKKSNTTAANPQKKKHGKPTGSHGYRLSTPSENAIKINKLETAAQLSALIQCNDTSTRELLGIDFGEFLQWLQQVIPQNENMVVLAAYHNSRVVSYLVGVTCIVPPLYNYATVCHLFSGHPGAIMELGRKFEGWARAKGAKKILVETFKESAARLYREKFGFKEIGTVLMADLTTQSMIGAATTTSATAKDK